MHLVLRLIIALVQLSWHIQNMINRTKSYFQSTMIKWWVSFPIRLQPPSCTRALQYDLFDQIMRIIYGMESVFKYVAPFIYILEWQTWIFMCSFIIRWKSIGFMYPLYKKWMIERCSSLRNCSSWVAVFKLLVLEHFKFLVRCDIYGVSLNFGLRQIRSLGTYACNII